MARGAVLILPKSGDEISCSFGYIDESCGVWPRLAIFLVKQRAASGTEAQRATTVKQGVVHDGPTAESGDAQGSSA